MLTDEQDVASASIAGTQAGPSLSIVIEWENVLLAGDDRAWQMLESLAPQIDRLLTRSEMSAEVLVVVDAADDVDRIKMAFREFFPIDNQSLSLRGINAEGVKYHEKKNVGAAAARGDIIIFLDSDVIPERDWLEHIYDSFSDPAVQVVGGA